MKRTSPMSGAVVDGLVHGRRFMIMAYHVVAAQLEFESKR
jgi:hypothetical protein